MMHYAVSGSTPSNEELAHIAENIEPSVTSIAGYGFTSYKMSGVWLPYSFLIAFAVLSVMILMMLISSITRYFIVKDKK